MYPYHLVLIPPSIPPSYTHKATTGQHIPQTNLTPADKKNLSVASNPFCVATAPLMDRPVPSNQTTLAIDHAHSTKYTETTHLRWHTVSQYPAPHPHASNDFAVWLQPLSEQYTTSFSCSVAWATTAARRHDTLTDSGASTRLTRCQITFIWAWNCPLFSSDPLAHTFLRQTVVSCTRSTFP